ncbi:MAG: zinc-ribbon domain-containing protein [Methanobacteriota archaeon]|nr:MAG: zinc-ribbon domain-containing protein [Euryarchaeota archaeon]
MADPVIDPIVNNALLIVLTILVILTVVTLLELRFFRSLMKRRQARVDLPDQAHNALLTSKAIADTLRGSGVVTAEADDAIRDAEVAYRRRNYRVAIASAERARGLLKTAKARQDKLGDLSRLQRTRVTGSDEPTTKETLQKELPPNYAQAKFTMSLAEERIVNARGAGRATEAAEGLLQSARASFDAKDFTGALLLASKSRRAADADLPPEPAAVQAKAPVPPQVAIPRPTDRTCASCGAALLTGDTFCRKCGVKVEQRTTCTKCGAPLKADDTFCRACGTPVA